MNEVKPGIQTSEFYGKTLVQLVVLGLAHFNVAVAMDTALIIMGGLDPELLAGQVSCQRTWCQVCSRQAAENTYAWDALVHWSYQPNRNTQHQSQRP